MGDIGGGSGENERETLIIKNLKNMFGIEDFGIVSAFVLIVLCVLFSIWYGVKYWNKEDKRDGE